MVLGPLERCLLKLASVTKSPAVIPLKGTSHCVSENRILAGLVHICSWSSKNSFPSPLKLPVEGGAGSGSGSIRNFLTVAFSFPSLLELSCSASFPLCACACGVAGLETGTVSVKFDATQPNASTIKYLRLMNVSRLRMDVSHCQSHRRSHLR